MRRVLLHRHAFLGNALCQRGSIVEIADDERLADYMTEVAAEAAAHHDISVRYSEKQGEVDISVDGTVTHLDHAALKLRVD